MLQIADRVLHLNNGLIKEIDKEKVISESVSRADYLKVISHEEIKIN
jgi:hypothetical protein